MTLAWSGCPRQTLEALQGRSVCAIKSRLFKRADSCFSWYCPRCSLSHHERRRLRTSNIEATTCADEGPRNAAHSPLGARGQPVDRTTFMARVEVPDRCAAATDSVKSEGKNRTALAYAKGDHRNSMHLDWTAKAYADLSTRSEVNRTGKERQGVARISNRKFSAVYHSRNKSCHFVTWSGCSRGHGDKGLKEGWACTTMRERVLLQ